MRHFIAGTRSISSIAFVAAALSLAAMPSCHAAAVGASGSERSAPNLSLGAAEFPGEDAIILRWEQSWSLEENGAVRRRDHQWLKLLNGRPIGRVADPRIDFVRGREELIIHTARTHLPNGEILPVPDYSFNYAAPDDVASWPQYAGWQQQVICFSGIEDGAVIELDYEVVTPEGDLPWLQADLRLHEDYPCVDRIVSVTVPQGTALHHLTERVPPEIAKPHETVSGRTVTYRWTFEDLASAPAEQQSPPWHQRCGRLRFTTAPNAAAWVSAIVDRVVRAGQPDKTVEELVKSVVEDETDSGEGVRKVAKKLHDSFNFVTSPKAVRSLECRSASQVLRANYGNPLESAALLLAAVRSMGLAATPAVGVDAAAWSESDSLPPIDSALAGVAVRVDLPDGPLWVDPQCSVFTNPGGWGRHWLLGVDDAGKLQPTYVRARGEEGLSELEIIGKVSIGPDGKATGELRTYATGLFFDPSKLKTADAQEKLVKKLVGRVVSDFGVSGHSIVMLSDEVFRATASVASKEKMEELGELVGVELGGGPAFLAEVPMPLTRSYRSTDVRLEGAFRERIELTIECPKGWKPAIIPADLPRAFGPWGTAEQTVEVLEKGIRLRRNVVVKTDSVAQGDFESLRQAINDLRAARSLVAAFAPPPDPDRSGG